MQLDRVYRFQIKDSAANPFHPFRSHLFWKTISIHNNTAQTLAPGFTDPHQLKSTIAMAEETPYQRTPADPEGDLEFRLGPPGRPSTIRVSAKILSMSSPVFKTMFRPEFNKDLALSSSQPFKMDLPDDDADAMAWLFHALHLHPDLDHDPEFAIREQIAYLCNKYQCSRALKPWTRVWLQQWRDASNTSKDRRKNHFKMLCIANALDDRVQFWHSTHDIICFCRIEDFPSEEMLADSNELGLALLPEGLLEHLQQRVDTVLTEITNFIEEAIDHYIPPKTALKPTAWGPECDLGASPAVCQCEAQLAHIFTELKRLSFWPAFRLRSMGLEQVHENTKKYRRLENTPHYSPSRRRLPQCECSFGLLSSYLHLECGAVLIKELEVAGLCLDCVKARRYSKEDNCHCRHVEEQEICNAWSASAVATSPKPSTR
ncbi:MAG: hypothetical protein Q9179_001730 [Wetmoreana sp. 5 TL-2023]